MNTEYFGLEPNMLSRPGTPRRRPPPPSPSRSLMGMEKVIPPNTPSPHRSPMSPPADVDKPLPLCPRKGSSVYSDDSGDSGYTKIIEMYENWSVDVEPERPVHVDTNAYRVTLVPLLVRRFGSVSSPISPLAVPKFVKQSTSIPSLRLTPDDSPSLAATDVKNAPSFVEFSRSLKAARSDLVSPLTSLASPHYAPVSPDVFWQPTLKASPEFRAITFEHEREHLPCQISPRITDVVDSHLVPPPLDLNRSSLLTDPQSDRLSAQRSSYETASEQGSTSRFSNTSSSEDSFVVYTGVGESIRAMIRTRLGNRKDTKNKSKAKTESIESTKDPLATSHPYGQSDRKFSWTSSRRSSLQQGVSTLLRTLSLTTSNPAPAQPQQQQQHQPRTRQKQLAIPLSSYQKYGPAVWHNSQRKKRRQARAAAATARAPQSQTQAKRTPTTTVAAAAAAVEPVGIRRRKTQIRRRFPASPSPPPPVKQSDVVRDAFHSGRDQLLHALDETRLKVGAVVDSKGREMERQRRKRKVVVRTASEKRRLRLKQSITLVGVVDPYSIQVAGGEEVDRASGSGLKERGSGRVRGRGSGKVVQGEKGQQYEQIDTEAASWV